MIARVVGVCAAIAVVIALGWGGHEVFGSCTVGVTGTDATVTVKGWKAGAECRRLRATDSTGLYDRREPPTGDVMCEMPHGRQRYIVRDRGLLMVVGRSLCAWLPDPSGRRRPAQ